MKAKFIHNSNPIFLIFVFSLILASVHSYFALSNIEPKIALKSFGLIDYANHKLLPQNFVNDWPNGILNLSLSAPIALLTWLHHQTGVSILLLLKVAAFIQALLVCLSVGWLSWIIMKDVYGVIIFLSLCLVSAVPFVNLAVLGTGIGGMVRHDIQWGFALAFSFFFLAAVLEEKYWIALLCLVAAVYCHLTIGLFAFLFIIPHIVSNLKKITMKQYVAFISSFAILLLPYIYQLSKHNVTGVGFPTELYIKILQIFSFHHFPVVMDCFTTRAAKEFLPILFLLILFFYILTLKDSLSKKDTIILKGTIFSLFLTAFYVLFSEVWQIPLIIKLQFHRISYYISFFASLYLVKYLIEEAYNDFIGLVATSVIIVLLFLSIPGMPFILIWLYMLFRSKGRILLKAMVSLAFFIVLFYYHKSYGVPFANFGFGQKYIVNNYLVILFIIASTTVILLKKFSVTYATLSLMLITLLMVGIIEFKRESTWTARHLHEGTDYVNVQVWARNNTPSTSLFMVDPSWGYGWRDFSQRSKFGSIGEWLYTPVSQGQDLRLFEKGVERAKDFGIDFNAIDRQDIYDHSIVHYGDVLLKTTRTKFYSMPGKDMFNLCSKYSIDYIVMRKKFVSNQELKSLQDFFSVVYENPHFIVFKPGHLL